jgi:integrase
VHLRKSPGKRGYFALECSLNDVESEYTKVKTASRTKKAPAKGSKSMSWADAVGAFENALDHGGRSNHTAHHYRDDLRAFATWWAKASPHEELTPQAITDDDLGEWQHHLRTEPMDQAGRTRKPATINAKMAAVKSFLRWAHRTRLIADLPEVPKARKLAKRQVKSLEPDKQRQLIRHAGRDRIKRNRWMVTVMIETGVRVAELLAWRWDVDIKLGERGGTWEVQNGKGCKPRGPFPMSKPCSKAFRNLRELDKDAKPGDPIFISQRKNPAGGRNLPLTIRGVQELLRRYAVTLKWERLHPHQLRHSFAFNKKAEGNDWPVIAHLMGHSSTITTMDSYGTATEAQVNTAMKVDDDFDDDDDD